MRRAGRLTGDRPLSRPASVRVTRPSSCPRARSWRRCWRRSRSCAGAGARAPRGRARSTRGRSRAWRPAGDTAVQIAHLRVAVLVGLAADRQGRVLHRDVDVFLAEAGHRDHHAVVVFAELLDVVRWITRRAGLPGHGRFQQTVHAVVPDRGPEQGRKVDRCHHMSSFKSNYASGPPDWAGPLFRLSLRSRPSRWRREATSI